MINLTDEEYRKFSLWCRQEADSYEAITAQMEKGSLGVVMDTMAKANRAKIVAFRVVSQHMDSTERTTIS